MSQLAVDFAGGANLQALSLGLEASDRQNAGQALGDTGAEAVGAADREASDLLQAALTETVGTSGGPPLDPYTAGLVTSTVSDIRAEAIEQGHQVDIAATAGGHGRLAVLGLSLSALAGVLVGLALVLREGRPGWTALLAACGIECLAIVAGVAAAIV